MSCLEISSGVHIAR